MKPTRPPIWIMMLTGMMVTLVAMVCARLAYGLILPLMRQDLGLSYAEAGNLGTASALGYLCLVMIAGIFAARHGGRAAVLLGLGMTTIGFTGLALASHYWLLTVFMLFLGVGTAFAYTPVLALLTSWFPERRGAVIGVANSGIGFGLAGMGAAFPFIEPMYGSDGWRVAWTVFAIASAVTCAATFAFLRNSPGHPVKTGAAGAPALNKMAVYKNPHVVVVGILYGVIGVTYIAQAIFMFSFALDAGVSIQTAGRLATINGILSILASPSWGWLSDRFDRATVLTTAVAANLIGTLIPVLWPSVEGFTLHYLITGCTISGMFTSIIAVSGTNVTPQQAPLALSYVTLFYAAGQFIGPALAGLLIEHVGGFRLTFAVSCMVMCIGVYLSWRLHHLADERKPVIAPQET